MLYRYPNRTGYPGNGLEKLAVPLIFKNENRQTGISGIDGHAGFHVSERISVGDNSIIGFNTTILAHEYLIEEYRLGDVEIGSNVMVGANSTILPGVKIGDGAIVSAATLVHKDVPAGAMAGGNPMRIIFTAEQMAERKRMIRRFGKIKCSIPISN